MLQDKDLDKVCKLAKIKIEDSQRSAFLEKLNMVFNWIEQLNKIDVSQININDLSAMDSTPEAPDVPSITNTREQLLSNTTHQKFNMFSVPKVVE